MKNSGLAAVAIAVAAALWFLDRNQGAAPPTYGSYPDVSTGNSTRSTGVASITSDAWDNLLEGIKGAEGGDNMSINNPGNLHWGNLFKSGGTSISLPPKGHSMLPGQIGVTGNDSGEAGRAIFSDPGDGWTALDSNMRKIVSENPDADFWDLAHRYVDGSDASDWSVGADNWAKNVTNYLGVDPSMSVADYLAGGGNG